MLQFVAFGLIGLYYGTKYLLDDDNRSSSDYSDSDTRRAQQQAHAEAQARLAEQERQQARDEQAQRNRAESQALDLDLQSLCRRFELPPCSLSEWRHNPMSRAQQCELALVSQDQAAQRPYQIRISTLQRALAALDELR